MSAELATQPVCKVGISGGLGNQMFQYAAARAMSLRTNAHLQLDLSFYDKSRHRGFQLGSLPITAELIWPRGRTRVARHCRSLLRGALRPETTYREPHFHYDHSFEALQPPVTLRGYFQSERYFVDHAHSIRRDFALPRPTDVDSLRWFRQMSDICSTSLHIRRGDYVTNPKANRIYAGCAIDYYTAAMEQIPGNDPVFVFSDDPQWVRENLPPVKPLVFCVADTPRGALDDLWLMAQAHHHIIANSSFSWWGAWLAGAEKGMTIAPRKWFNDTSVEDRDLVPGHWTRI